MCITHWLNAGMPELCLQVCLPSTGMTPLNSCLNFEHTHFPYCSTVLRWRFFQTVPLSGPTLHLQFPIRLPTQGRLLFLPDTCPALTAFGRAHRRSRVGPRGAPTAPETPHHAHTPRVCCRLLAHRYPVDPHHLWALKIRVSHLREACKDGSAEGHRKHYKDLSPIGQSF